MPTTFRVRQLLEERGMSQSELARAAGVSFATVNRMCTNATEMVSLSTLDKIAAALKLAPGELIERKRGR